jgi:hypothetical protein
MRPTVVPRTRLIAVGWWVPVAKSDCMGMRSAAHVGEWGCLPGCRIVEEVPQRYSCVEGLWQC